MQSSSSSDYEILQAEYVALNNEIKRKHPSIKENVDLAIASLKAKKFECEVGYNTAEEQCAAILLNPLSAIFSQKLNKFYIPAMGCVQKVVETREPLTKDFITGIVSILSVAAESSQERVLLKTLQILMMIQTPEALRRFPKFSFSVLEIGLRLYNCRSSNVKNTCVVALRRVVSLVSECFLNIHNSPTPVTKSELVLENLVELFRTLATHIESDKKNPECVAIYPFSRWMGLTMLSQLLGTVEDTVLPYEQVTRLVKYKLVSLLQTLVNTVTKDYPLTVRLFKCIVLINLHLSVGYGLLRVFLQHISAQNYSWQKFLALEGMQILCGSAQFLNLSHELQAFGSRNISLFEQIVFTLLSQVQTASNLVVKSGGGAETPVILSRLRDATFNQEPPNCDGIVAFRLSTELLGSLVESIGVLVEESGLKIGYLPREAFNTQQVTCKRMVRSCWEPVLKILSTALKVCRDETMEQSLLNSQQKLVSICGSIDELATRDTLLTNLCQYCVPKEGTQLHSKNVLAIKTLLNISHCLGSILDTKAWFIILQTFQQVHFFLAQQHSRRGGINTSKVDFPSTQARIRTAMERFSPEFVQKLRMQKYNPGEARSPAKPPLQRAISLRRGKSAQENVKNEDSEPHNVPETPPHRATLPGPEKNNNDAPSIESEEEKAHSSGVESMREINQNVIDYSKQLHERIQSLTSFGFFTELVGKASAHEAAESEYEILESSIDSLFISSVLFDADSLKDLLVALGQINLNSLQKLGVESLSVAKYKMHVFGILKMFEVGFANSSRYSGIWNILVTHFEGLANSDVEFIRSIAVEAVVALVTHIFREGPEDQSQVLQPFSHLVRASYQDTQVIVLKALPQFLRDCGSQLTDEGWEVLLLALHRPPHEELQLSHIYNCADIVVQDHLQRIVGTNFVSLVELLFRLSSSQEGASMNVPLNSVNLFYNLADALGKRLLANGVSEPSIAELWGLLLDKLKDLGRNHRQELRQSAVHAIENALVKHCSKMEFPLCQSLIEKSVLGLLIDTFRSYSDQRRGGVDEGRSSGELGDSIAQEGGLHALPASMIPGDSPTPKFSLGGGGDSKGGQGRLMRFDQEFLAEYSRKKDVEPTRWDDSCVLITQTMLRLIKTLRPAKFDGVSPSDVEGFGESLWKNLCANMRGVIRVGSTDLNHKLITAIRDGGEVAIRCFSSTFSLYEQLKDWVNGPYHDRQPQRKALHTKVSAAVYDNWKVLLLKSENWPIQPLILEIKTCKTVLDLINKEGGLLSGFGQKLGQQQKMLFALLQELAPLYCPGESTRDLYKRELLSLMTFYQAVPHSEHFVRSAFEISQRRLAEGYFLRLPEVRDLIERYIELLKLRYNELASPFGQNIITIRSSKASKPLWCLAGLEYLKLVQIILEAPVGVTEPMKDQEVYIEQQVKDYIWESVLSVLEKHIVLKSYELREMENKGVLETIYQFSQELDMEVTTVAIKVLLPSCKDKVLQKQLVRLVDNGCNAEYGHNSEFSQKSLNYSTFCLTNLFTLCHATSESMSDIREELAFLTAPVLLKRCREMIELYIMDERRTGSMSMKRSRITEIIFLFDKLQSLQLVPGSLAATDAPENMKGPKAHLLLLMPLLAHCVISKEVEIREKLRDIFLTIGEQLHIPS